MIIHDEKCIVSKNYEITKSKEYIGDVKGLYKNTLTYPILTSHSKGDDKNLQIKFDALCSHDITYVGIIQSARYSGLKQFPVPYVLTNCHNSLCAVGGTINEDDHVFGLSAAKKFGGIYVPPNIAVIHQYMREKYAGCGKMILGSDSHTRYGALGTIAIGEGGPELVKQILSRTYNIEMPRVIAVVLKGKPRLGVGPQDVAIKLIGSVFSSGFVKNAVLEFVGDGIRNISMDYRIGIDVMTTETACLSSIWETDENTREYLSIHGREIDYRELKLRDYAEYDGAIEINLDEIVPMIAMPFHPSNAYELRDVINNPYDILSEVENKTKSMIERKDLSLKLTDKIENGKIRIDQGVIAGCAGGIYENIIEASNILYGGSIGSDKFSLSVYPSSMPIYSELVKNGAISSLVNAGAIIKPCFCGPCFGAGDVPSNNALSIRHSTRNFPMREGAKPNDGQLASVALMDARSIAATAKHGGFLTAATEEDYLPSVPKYYFNDEIYKNRVYDGYMKPQECEDLIIGPNIAMWPEIEHLKKNILLKNVAVILDEVTTTDELIPSGETSSYRSNPLKLASFTLSRKEPMYVDRAKAVQNLSENGGKELDEVLLRLKASVDDTNVKSFIFAKKPGDGSAREQAASCQRVLGGGANAAIEYATKRYRSNLINWGMLPLLVKDVAFELNDWLYIEDIYGKIKNNILDFDGLIVRNGQKIPVSLSLGKLTDNEREILLAGCLMNYYKN